MKLGRKCKIVPCKRKERKKKRNEKKESYRHVLIRTKWEFKEKDTLVIFLLEDQGA